MLFFVQAEDGIRDLVRSRGLGDVYKRQLELDVVIEHARLVGVDVPLTRVEHGGGQADICQGVVEIAGLSVEDIGVGFVAAEGVHQISVARVAQGGDRVFLGVAVEVADDQEVGVAALCRCLLYTSDAADERSSVDLGGRSFFKKKKNNNKHEPQLRLKKEQTHKD